MSWTDFESDSALERDLLQRALPLMPTSSDGSCRATIDLAADRADIAIAVSETIGPNPAGCIDLLCIRPLLVGAAWKVLDLLLESALNEADMQPDTRHRWTITRKVAHARAGDGRPGSLTVEVWAALTRTFVETEELRHSLIHRRAYTDASGSLIGTNEAGDQLRPLTPIEQDAFGRLVLRAGELVTAANPDDRVEADLIRQLGALSGLHAQSLPIVNLLDSLPEITVIVDPDVEGVNRYLLNMPALRARQPFQGATHADLIIRFRDRPGQEARGRLERAPIDVIFIDPDELPPWLT